MISKDIHIISYLILSTKHNLCNSKKWYNHQSIANWSTIQTYASFPYLNIISLKILNAQNFWSFFFDAKTFNEVPIILHKLNEWQWVLDSWKLSEDEWVIQFYSSNLLSPIFLFKFNLLKICLDIVPNFYFLK